MSAYRYTTASRTPHRRARAAARSLGWITVGLGAAALLAPRLLTGAVGLRGREGALRALGLREVITGVGILAARRPTRWLWLRVATDALYFAALESAGGARRPQTRFALAGLAGMAAVDAGCAATLERIERRGKPPCRDYRDRRGLPLPANAMRGAALKDFEMPSDMATPALLAPWPPTALQA